MLITNLGHTISSISANMLTVIPTAYDGHFVFFLLAQNWFFKSVCKNLLSTVEDFDGWTLIGYQSLGDSLTDNCRLIRDCENILRVLHTKFPWDSLFTTGKISL